VVASGDQVATSRHASGPTYAVSVCPLASQPASCPSSPGETEP